VEYLTEFRQDNDQPEMATGIPLGSGAIESGIRRVINRRMKNNGMYWLEENAEIMLQLRCQVISERWDENMRRCVA
jgi:hypothetical protein